MKTSWTWSVPSLTFLTLLCFSTRSPNRVSPSDFMIARLPRSAIRPSTKTTMSTRALKKYWLHLSNRDSYGWSSMRFEKREWNREDGFLGIWIWRKKSLSFQRRNRKKENLKEGTRSWEGWGNRAVETKMSKTSKVISWRRLGVQGRRNGRKEKDFLETQIFHSSTSNRKSHQQ